MEDIKELAPSIEPAQAPETVESAATDNQSQTTENQEQTTEIDNSRPVTTLSAAKEILKAQKSQKESKAQESKANKSSGTDNLDYRKQYSEMQKVVGKQSQELNELRRFQQESKSMYEAWKQQQAQVDQQALQRKMQEDPQAAYAEIARRETLQYIAPLQEQFNSIQASNIHQSIQQQVGGQYDALAPIMHEALTKFEEMDAARGTNYAQEVASNPRMLIELAKEEHGKRTASQAVNTSKQKQAENLRIASGVAKNSNVKSTSTPESFSTLSLADMTKALKSQGILK